MSKDVKIEVMDKLTKVCVCRGISRAAVKKAIKNGAKTVDEIKKVTGAGSGSCKGRNCGFKIQKILNECIKTIK